MNSVYLLKLCNENKDFLMHNSLESLSLNHYSFWKEKTSWSYFYQSKKGIKKDDDMGFKKKWKQP